RHLRSCHATWSTPCGPEIREHRHTRFMDDLIELLNIHFQRFVYGRQRRFAVPASPSIGEMLGRHSVGLPTVFTRSKYGHEHLREKLAFLDGIRPAPSAAMRVG